MRIAGNYCRRGGEFVTIMDTAAYPNPDAIGVNVKLDLELLRPLVPLDNLGRKSLRYIADHGKLMQLAGGDVVFDLGDTRPFTFYLLRGALRLKDDKGKRTVVEAGSERGRYAIGNLLPRRFNARIVSQQAILMRVDRDLLEKEIAWGQLSQVDKKGEKAEDNEWRVDLLRTPVFSRLPMASVQRLFEALEEVPAKAGDVIVKEGEPGDFYYILRSGKCKVVREVGGRELRMGALEAPQGFGDEALVSNKPRNATVVMESDGLLLRLSKADFQELLHAPLVKKVKLAVAESAIAEKKAMLLDVRMEEEFTQNRLPHAINIPLFLLHLKLLGLNKGFKYVVYCDTGQRSEAASFILTRNGFDSYVLEDAQAALANG